MKSPRTKTLAVILAVVLGVYLVLAGYRASTLILSGRPVFVLLGISILVLPVLGAVLVAEQLRFGAQTEKLARILEAEDGLPDTSQLPRKPSGRVERTAADAWFDERQAEMEADPENWRGWFRLAQAYDIAGDRPRARKAMRKAIALHSEA